MTYDLLGMVAAFTAGVWCGTLWPVIPWPMVRVLPNRRGVVVPLRVVKR